MNYPVNDVSGPIIVRAVDALGVSPFEVGEIVTARGAGNQWHADYQILVGNPTELFRQLVAIESRTWSQVKDLYRR